MNTKVTSYFTQSWQEPFWRIHALPLLLLFAVPLLLYWPALQYDYVLDDKIVITKNEFTQKGFSGIWDLLSTETFTGYFQEQRDLIVGGRYRPLSLVTFALEHQFFGLNPKVSHGLNILLYALTGLLIYRIFTLLYYRPLVGRMLWLFGVPFWAALIFMVHPLHVEAVANIKGRDELMSLLGSLTALYFSLRHIHTQKSRYLLYMALVLFLACLSKENAVTWVVIIPAALWVFVSINAKQVIRVAIWLLLPVMAYLLIRYQVIGYFLDSGTEITNLMNNPFAEMSGRQKYATIFYTLWVYLKLLFFPYPLTHDYYPYHIPILDWNNGMVLFSFLLHIGLLLASIVGILKKRRWSFPIFYYLITLSIVSNLFFTVGTFMNERFVYASSLGYSLLLGQAWVHQIEKKNRMGLALLAFLVVGIYGFLSFNRLPAWKDTLSLNMAAIEVSTQSARANLFAGTALYNEKALKMERGEEKKAVLLEARNYLLKSLAIHPSYQDALSMLGGVAGAIYDIDRQVEPLLEDFSKVLENRPMDPYVYSFLEYLNRSLGPAKVLQDFYFAKGYTFFQTEKYNSNAAMKMIQLGLSVNPNNAELLWSMAQINYRMGNKNEGDRYLLRARNINPSVGL
jgi:hypothetical protein